MKLFTLGGIIDVWEFVNDDFGGGSRVAREVGKVKEMRFRFCREDGAEDKKDCCAGRGDKAGVVAFEGGVGMGGEVVVSGEEEEKVEIRDEGDEEVDGFEEEGSEGWEGWHYWSLVM